MIPLAADVLLTDGSVAVIRPLLPSDRPGLEELHAKASDRSIRMRFFIASKTAGSDYVAHLFSGSGDVALALVATDHGQVVATATAERIDPATAEVAFLVSDADRGRGLGTLLLEHLAAAGHSLGIDVFTAEVLAENRAMLRVFTAAGFTISRHAESGVVELTVDTTSSTRSLSSADERESQAEARSLAPLLRPETVAVLGVRRDGSGTGAAVLGSIRRGGFAGRSYVVHPAATDRDHLTAYRSLTEVPEHIDLAAIAVPAARVPEAMADAVAAGVSSVVVISSGFAEMGPEGVEIQRRLQRTARDHSIRLVGPNCLGVLANDPEVRLNATFASLTPPAGGLAIASQSGGVGIALLDLTQQTGLGVRSFVSLGNKADVSGNDLLAAWLPDPEVVAAALYLESFGNARKFARLAARFAERKPLLAVVGGRSDGGRRGGASHTAAAATSAVGVDALFAQSGVVACRDAHDLVHTARLLVEQPLPGGDRVAVVSNAGGLGVLAADEAARSGLAVPELSPGLCAQIQRGVSGTVGVSNPVDLGAGVTAADLAAALAPLLDSDEVDIVVVLLVATVMTEPGTLEGTLADLRPGAPDKPVLLVGYGDEASGAIPGLTRFVSARAAFASLAHALSYAAWRGVPHHDEEPFDRERATTAGRVGRDLLARADGGSGWLPPAEVTELLAPYALAPIGRVATTARDALDTARSLGGAVAIKVADPEIVHKSDLGLVRTGLATPSAVEEALAAFAGILGTAEVPVLVQPMVDGVEVALGMVRDASFGPMVMVAAGGVDIDVWDDRVFLLAPVSARDAARAVRSLRIRPLLEGHRGRPVADVASLERCLVSLGRLALDVPEIAELDLNPVLVGTDRVWVVDAKVRLAAAPAADAGLPRQLRATRATES